MPELPEVESVRRALAVHLPGRSVTAVRGSGAKLRREVDPDVLHAQMVGQTFAAPEREAKFLILRFESAHALLVHLGMTGRFTVHNDADEERAPHTHLEIDLDDDRQIRFVNPRRFGVIAWLPAGATDPSLERLGLDPLDDAFVETVAPLMKARKTAMKNVLMDQTLIGGLGNIYVTEALHRAGIHPLRTGRRTALKRLRAVATHAQEILREAIEAGGTTLRDYADPDGRTGEYVQVLGVYGRQGEACDVCGTTIKAMTIANRTTAFCPTCQR